MLPENCLSAALFAQQQQPTGPESLGGAAMHESIRVLIERERARREKSKRFINVAKPFINGLMRELGSILEEYRQEFQDDRKIARINLLHSGLGLRMKRLPDGPSCEVYADQVRCHLLVTRSKGEPLEIPVAYDKGDSLALLTTEPTISAFAAGIIAPILFPELIKR
jgi:hypothetical protein